MVEHLFSFKHRFHVAHHSESLERSLCKWVLTSGEEIGMMHLASSAKSKILENKAVLGRSFTKIRNSSGPRILPSGTLERTGKVLEVE